MSTHPFIPLYVDDYDAHTAHLTPAQDGIYGRLLRLAWRTPGCSLPNDEAWIARKVRLSASEWQRIGKPVLDEFFRLQRGRLVQKRLKVEYDDITRKKTARRNAGKMGGTAKARKTKENGPSNATVLLPDAGAFQNQNQSQKKNPPTPLPGGDARSALFELAWNAYPVEGRGNHGPEPSWAEWPSAADRAGGEAALVAAVEARAAWLATKPRERAKAFHRWLRDGGFMSYVRPEAPGRVAAAWSGPSWVRTAVVDGKGEPFAKSWLDGCGWQDVPPAVVSSSPTATKRLRDEAGPLLDGIGVQLVERAA